MVEFAALMLSIVLKADLHEVLLFELSSLVALERDLPFSLSLSSYSMRHNWCSMRW